MPKLHADLALAKELLAHRFIVAKALAERLDAEHASAAGVDRAIDAGKRAGADEIEDLVIAVKVAALFALQQSIELIVGQQLLAQQHAGDLVERNFAGAKIGPQRLNLTSIENASVADPLKQLVRANRRHDRAADRRMARGNDSSAGFRSGGKRAWLSRGRRVCSPGFSMLFYRCNDCNALVDSSGWVGGFRLKTAPLFWFIRISVG